MAQWCTPLRVHKKKVMMLLSYVSDQSCYASTRSANLRTFGYPSSMFVTKKKNKNIKIKCM